MGYTGTERRVHKVFFTRNTEYHVRRDLCVGVRDRKTGHWFDVHLALHGRMHGGLRFSTNGSITPNSGPPTVGESLFFQVSGRDVVTSTVVCVDRPPREIVSLYEH